MDWSSIPGLGRCPGGGHGNPLQDPAWRIPWTEEPGRVQSHEKSDMTEPLSMHALPAAGGSPHLMSRMWVGCIVSHQLTYGGCVTPMLAGERKNAPQPGSISQPGVGPVYRRWCLPSIKKRTNWPQCQGLLFFIFRLLFIWLHGINKLFTLCIWLSCSS